VIAFALHCQLSRDNKSSGVAEASRDDLRQLTVVQLYEQELSSSGDGRPFGHNRHGPKSGGCCAPFWGRGAGFPSNTMWPGPSPPPCQVSSWSIQPFGYNTPTWQTDRQTENGLIAQGESFYKRLSKITLEKACNKW